MIFKSFEINKIDKKVSQIILFYGKNEGLKYEAINTLIKNKIKILKLYKSEVKSHPHPRSIKSVKALSQIRGSQSGYKNAESFHLVFEKDEI